jgi:hypothetical protein
MQKQQSTRNGETTVQSVPACKQSPFLQFVEARAHRKVRIALPSLPRRQFCLANRTVLAAMRAAELAVWQASGGDFLRNVRPN